MMETQTPDDDGDDVERTNDAEDEEMVFPTYAAEPIPREGFVPAELQGSRWPHTLGRVQQHTDAMYGGKTEVSYKFVGLDSRGRAVYLKSGYNDPKLMWLVPAHHEYFEQPDDASPVMEPAPKHSPATQYANAPNGDVLVAVKSESVGFWERREASIEKRVVAHAAGGNWNYISESFYRRIKSELDTEGFPTQLAESLLEEIGDKPQE